VQDIPFDGSNVSSIAKPEAEQFMEESFYEDPVVVEQPSQKSQSIRSNLPQSGLNQNIPLEAKSLNEVTDFT
jgi:hypothetical protein